MKNLFIGVFIYRSSIELEFGAFGSRIADNKQLDLVDLKAFGMFVGLEAWKQSLDL